MPGLTDKEEHLRRLLRPMSRVTVAYSGGVDSSLLLWLAVDTLGAGNVLAVLGESASLPGGEQEPALEQARAWGAVVHVVATTEMENPDFVRNGSDRCYHCKRLLIRALQEDAARHFAAPSVLLDGTNADDTRDHRPGRQAAAEAGVRTPLLDAGLTKAEIRELSRRHGLPAADRPASPCLASRLPYGTPVTAAVLRQVGAAEEQLHALGFTPVRVRHHGTLARIEVMPAEIPRAAALAATLVGRLKPLGYTYVALDLAGFRSGSLNEVLNLPSSHPKPPT